jgi:hypothetical protein
MYFADSKASSPTWKLGAGVQDLFAKVSYQSWATFISTVKCLNNSSILRAIASASISCGPCEVGEWKFIRGWYPLLAKKGETLVAAEV